MKAFVHKLVGRLIDRSRPLSRNRHFHTFENPDGRKALRVSRQLRSLSEDLLRQAQSGQQVRITCLKEGEEVVRVQIDFVRLKARRTTYLSPQELQLLMQSEEVRAIIEQAMTA